MTDLIIIAVVVAIVGFAVFYIRREKRRGVQCVGCPESKTCSGSCGGNCSGCNGCAL